MTTVFDLMDLISYDAEYDEKPALWIYDKTGNFKIGVFYKGDKMPVWLNYVGVDSFELGGNALFINLIDFKGDLITRNDDFSIRVLGFDYTKDNDNFSPEYIIIKANHYARCEEKVKKLKLTPDSFGGYSFKVYGKKYTLHDVITY